MDSEQIEDEQTESDLVQAVAVAREAYIQATEVEKRPTRRRYFEALERFNSFQLAKQLPDPAGSAEPVNSPEP